MANKRALKKNVNLICDELYIDFIAASLYGNTHDDKILANIVETIDKMQSNTLSRISHPEPGMSKGKYFKDLKKQFKTSVLEIADQISNL